MNAQWRLDSKAPGVANAFRTASSERQRRATLAACETVIPIVGLELNAEVIAGLQALREGRSNNSVLQERICVLSGRFDDEYFLLDEEGDEAKKPEMLRLFSKARGASALAFALSDDASQLHETIYEAMSALIDDPSTLTRAVEAALRTSAPD